MKLRTPMHDVSVDHSATTCFVHSILGHPELPFESNGQAQSVASPPASGAGPRTQRRFVRVHCDDIRALSKTREARLVHVRCATRCSRRCGAARSAPRLLHRLPQSRRLLARHRRPPAVVAEWSTPTSCTGVRRFIGLADYYRPFVLRFSRGFRGPSMPRSRPSTATVPSLRESRPSSSRGLRRRRCGASGTANPRLRSGRVFSSSRTMRGR